MNCLRDFGIRGYTGVQTVLTGKHSSVCRVFDGKGQSLERPGRLLKVSVAVVALLSLGSGICLCQGPQNAQPVPLGGVSLLPHHVTEAIYWYPRSDPNLARNEIIEVQEMPFQRAIRTTTYREPRQAWDVVVGVNVSGSVEEGDVCLLSFYLRGTSLQDDFSEAKVRACVEFTHRPNDKIVTMALTGGKEWRRIYIPFRAERPLPERSVRVVFYLGFLPQTVEIGAITLLNFGRKLPIGDLPATRLTYRGREPDAPWRQQALERVERFRKAGFMVEVVDSSGKPVPDATVHIRMVRHAFGFGAAVAAGMLGINTSDTGAIRDYLGDKGDAEDIRTYRRMIEKLFNKATLENALKLKPWMRSRSNRDSDYRLDWTDRALEWLNTRDIAVRGHWIACGDLEELPVEIIHSPKYQLRAYLIAGIREKVKTVGNRVREWDTINHIVDGTKTLETRFGSRDIYVEIMKESRQLAPEAQLWVNEGFILADGSRRDSYEKAIRYLIAHDAAPDGIGFMGHFDGISLTPPDELVSVFDRFAKVIPKLQVTELDVDVGDDEQLQADYLRDVMTVAFSHEACQGIVIWGFWQNWQWKPDAALYRKDWSPKPAGRIWEELVFRQWWTDVQGKTDRDGIYHQRGFTGLYEVEVSRNHRSVTGSVFLPKEGTRVRISLD